MKTYYQIKTRQKFLEKMPGDNKFEPQYITQGSSGNMYWHKWKDKKPLKVNDFRIWTTDASNNQILVNLKDLYSGSKHPEDIISYHQTIVKQFFRCALQ